MGWFFQDSDPEKPKCEREFEAAHKKIKQRKKKWSYLNQAVHKEWVLPYLSEETHGTAILQRQHRLMQKQAAPAEQKHSGSDEKLPVYSAVPPTQKDEVLPALEKELAKLREEYWRHQIRLNQYYTSRPMNTIAMDEIVLLRKHRDRHNRPFAWVLNREKCAARGGCCGRTCGCCERPFYQYLQPGDHEQDTGKGRALIDVIGHCTVECACCIQSRSCYMPHPRLPPTAF